MAIDKGYTKYTCDRCGTSVYTKDSIESGWTDYKRFESNTVEKDYVFCADCSLTSESTGRANENSAFNAWLLNYQVLTVNYLCDGDPIAECTYYKDLAVGEYIMVSPIEIEGYECSESSVSVQIVDGTNTHDFNYNAVVIEESTDTSAESTGE